MKFSGSVASALLLLLPALVSAAPATERGLSGLDANNILVARAESCNAPVPKDKTAKAKYDKQIKLMKTATSDAHKSQDACPASKKKDFSDSKNKQARQLIKTNCVTNWTRAKAKRVTANGICSGLGGTIDWGHNNAVSYCDDQIKYWNGQTP